jgi:dihydrofolate synthase / folylpolyglutamate synthase
MHMLSTMLGMPQHRFASIHVVGTNGKSSVTRMAAALLEGRGLRTGACVSPHLSRWSERVLLGGVEIGAAEFSAAVERAAEAAAIVNRSLDEGESVTQFELATAAAFVAFATARVDVAVIEAGLGGRLDATNTIPSRVTVLTSVGIDHTKWLGETETAIAAEKLAVLRDNSILVTGRLGSDVEELSAQAAHEHGATLVRAPEDPGAEISLSVPGHFQRRNFSLALAAVEAFLGDELDRTLVAEVAAATKLPGRLEAIGADPPIFLDAAHNPDGAAALAESLPEIAAGRPVVGCIAILADKDAAGILSALAPALERAICTQPPGFPADGPNGSEIGTQSAHRRAVSAMELVRACESAGLAAEGQPDIRRALGRACELAGASDGIVVVTGSNYALAPAREAQELCED